MLQPADDSPRRWIDACLPVLVVVGVTVALLFYTGRYDNGKLREGIWDMFVSGNSYLAASERFPHCRNETRIHADMWHAR